MKITSLPLNGHRIRLVSQTEETECGLACIAMIAGNYGLELDLGALRLRFTTPTRGATLDSIIDCAEKLGFITRPLRIELEDLGAVRLPAIVHWNLNHFVVIEKVTKSQALVHDPAGTSSWLNIDKVSRSFTGVLLETWPSSSFLPGSFRQPLRIRQLWSSSSGLTHTIIQAFLLSLTLQALLLFLPLFSRYAVDDAISNPNIGVLNALGIGFILLSVVYGSLYWLRSRVLIDSGASISYALTINLARRLFRLPIPWFNSRHVGDILAKFQSITPIKKSLTEDISSGLLDGVFAILAVLIMTYFSPIIAAVAIVGLMSQAALRIALLKRLQTATKSAIVAAAREQTNVIQIVQGIRTLRLSNASSNRELRWRLRLAESINQNTSRRRVEELLSTGKATVTKIEEITFLWLCFISVLSAKITIGTAFALFAYRTQFSASVATLFDRVMDFKLLDLHLERISDIALSPEDARFSEGERPTRHFQGRLEFRDINYRYSNFDDPVLRGVSFMIAPGESVALTGPSGHGKSTLALIALGLVKPDTGMVLIDGVSLEMYGYMNYSQHVSSVLQDDVLFLGSIFDNIASFSNGASLEQVRIAAQQADIDDEILAMPMGYETPVGDMGAALSGGQKQRILIARALFSKPRFLVIDEGTSHLDHESEARVNAAISRLGVSRLIIAHRQETIRSADRAITIRNGIIV